MQNPKTGSNTIGISIQLGADVEDQAFLKHLMAPYDAYPLVRYNVCYGCWLKSLGIKL